MAIPLEKAAPLEQEAANDSYPEAMIDVDDMLAEGDDESLDDMSSSRFACSTQLRRKIEERLELKELKDELGFDDLDI